MFVAGALKVTNLPSSVLAVRAYKLLDYDFAAIVGYALPLVEMTIGLLLVVGVFTRVAAAINGAMLVSFIFGISWVWAHGYSLDCGCFGGGGTIAAAKGAGPVPVGDRPRHRSAGTRRLVGSAPRDPVLTGDPALRTGHRVRRRPRRGVTA